MPDPELTFGFRGEGITCRSAGKEMEMAFDYMKGAHLHTDTIVAWKDGTPLSDDEKASVFASALKLIKGNFERSIVVINTDDPSKPLWERLCETNRALIKGIEYTSNAAKAEFLRSTFLRIMQSGKLVVNGTEVRDEQTLDRVLGDVEKKWPGGKRES